MMLLQLGHNMFPRFDHFVSSRICHFSDSYSHMGEDAGFSLLQKTNYRKIKVILKELRKIIIIKFLESLFLCRVKANLTLTSRMTRLTSLSVVEKDCPPNESDILLKLFSSDSSCALRFTEMESSLVSQ